ncbi:MAG: TP0733 family outer membrane beta-barrel protein [Rectinemataceae bacterium]
MKSKTAAAIGLGALLILAATPFARAQTAVSSKPEASDLAAGSSDAGQVYAPYGRGDQTLSLAAGVTVPLLLSVPAQSSSTSAANLYTGGLFSFSYQYFLSHGLAIGGTIDGAFNGVIDGSTLFVAPLSFRTAYWWSLGAFELCTAVEFGAYLLDLDYSGTSNVAVDPFGKAGGGVYWRVSRGWSVGLQSYFWFLPEIKTNGDTTKDGYVGFLEVAIAAFYHL